MKKCLLNSKKLLDVLGNDAEGFSFSSDKNLELAEVKPGVWILTAFDSAAQTNTIDKTIISEKLIPSASLSPQSVGVEEKILVLLKQKSFAERVEGVFEGFLFKDELPIFQKLIQDGKIEKIKLSDKYKKPIYRIAEKKKESENPSAPQKEVEEYSLDKDGFLVVKNELRAKALSQQLEQDIKDGKVRGIKSFDGNFYIADNSLVAKYTTGMLEFLKHAKSANLEVISKALNISQVLARIVCEFAKEDGLIIEKRKDLYSYIS